MRLAAAALLFAAAAAGQTNPFAPLTAEEIRSAVRILRDSGQMPGGARFSTIVLDEPTKTAVLRGEPASRRAFAVLYDYRSNQTFEAIADLAARRVVSWKNVPGVEPPVTSQDSGIAERLVRGDPRFRQAMNERGIQDLEHVIVVAWSAGYFALPQTERARIVRAVCYYAGAGDNFYAHPIEGVVAHVDVTGRRILDFLDIDRDAPVSRENFEFAARSNRVPLRPGLPLAPLVIMQPDGAGFRVENGMVRWDRWHFRYALHPREGLVLYTVGFEDAGRVRSILNRASLSEMVVPYGDPGAGWFFRNSFDAGELGLGENASPLRPGADCPQNCSVYDAVFADEAGVPQTIRGAVAIYERDGGIAWKHGDETRRARELVIGYLTQVGNYEYGFDWIFRQDGTLQCRIALTGIMAVKGAADGAHDPYSHPIAKNIVAPHHQHFFNFRLDFDVDGQANRVLEMNSQALPPGRSNPYGNAFTTKMTPLKTEREAERQVNPQSSRRWIVENPAVTNDLGQPVGFALLPMENTVPYSQPDSWIRKRAGFLNAHLWVTPYRTAELYAGGDYPNQSRGGDGLPKWTAANRPIDNQDVVVWYTLGITHNPRPEDWPVMPVARIGFDLAPFGFFARNPVN
jgi:primary-amine oxidase